MSKKFISLSLIAFFVIGSMSSCKYEEGPFVSLRSKEERVANTWEIKKIIESDGEEKTGNEVPDDEYTYTDDGEYKVNGNDIAEWDFSGNKEEIEHESSFGSWEHEILKLKENEMWVEDEDGDEIHYEPA